MKKFIIFLICLSFSMMGFSQSLEKGNVVGQHVGKIVLNPDVTYNQFKSFYLTKYLPEFNKLFNGEITVYMIEGERGGEKDNVSFLYVFKSMDIRNKYFPKEGVSLDPALTAKLKPLTDQLGKLGRFSGKFLADWVVQ